jgi:hypothetical protein
MKASATMTRAKAVFEMLTCSVEPLEEDASFERAACGEPHCGQNAGSPVSSAPQFVQVFK